MKHDMGGFQHFSDTLIWFLITWSSHCFFVFFCFFFASDVIAIESANKFISIVCVINKD